MTLFKWDIIITVIELYIIITAFELYLFMQMLMTLTFPQAHGDVRKWKVKHFVKFRLSRTVGSVEWTNEIVYGILAHAWVLRWIKALSSYLIQLKLIFNSWWKLTPVGFFWVWCVVRGCNLSIFWIWKKLLTLDLPSWVLFKWNHWNFAQWQPPVELYAIIPVSVTDPISKSQQHQKD